MQAEYRLAQYEIRSHYYLGGERVATRVEGALDPGRRGVFYQQADHLGSTLGELRVGANGAVEQVGMLRYLPWGEARETGMAESATRYRFTGQRVDSTTNLYWYNSRWYDPVISQFNQPDSIIPDPYNPLDWNRYAYARYSPIRYSDPTGHWPEWLGSAIDIAQGATYQFVNDMTLGTLDRVATSLSLCMDCNRSDAYQQGQQAGRAASIVMSSTEAVLGSAAAAASLASMGPTAGGGILCGAVTAGGCLVIAGVGLTVEGAMVVGGVAVAGHGVASAVYIRGNPIQKHHPWPEYLLGPRKQQLYGLSQKLHSEYHTQLDGILSRQLGKDYYQQMIKSPGRLSEILEFLRDFNRYFDDTHGTLTYEALEDVLRNEGLLPKP